MELHLLLADDQGETIEVFCEVFERGGSVYWHAWLYGYAALRETLEGHAMDESAIAGQIQAQILSLGIRAAN